MNPDTQATVAWSVHSSPLGRDVTLRVRVATVRQMRRWDEWARTFHDRTKTDPKIEDVMLESVGIGIVGWDLPDAFTPEAMLDAFTFGELAAIARNWPDALVPTVEQQGKSESPQASQPVGSAAIAPVPDGA